MKKLFALVFVFTMVASLLVGCGSKSADTIKIGVNLELTGIASIYGIPERKAMELALEEINKAGGVLGKHLEFVFYDNEYDTAKAVENAIKFATEDNVVAMIGPATSATSLAVGAVAKQYEMVAFTPSATALEVTMDDTKVNPWVFRASFIDPFQGLVLANFASNDLKASKAVVMHSDSSDYSNGLAEAFEAKYTANGGTVVKTATYTDADTDFSAQLTSLSNLDFDVIFVADYAERGGLIVNQVRAMGLDVPVLGPDGFDTEDFNDLAGGSANVNNVFIVNHFSLLLDDPQVKTFIAAHEAKYGDKPNALAALAYDSVYMLAEAIKQADSVKPADIRDALENLGVFDGVTGNIKFNEFHNPVKSAVVIELKNGEQAAATVVQP